MALNVMIGAEKAPITPAARNLLMMYVQAARNRKPVAAASSSVPLQILEPRHRFVIDMPRISTSPVGLGVAPKRDTISCVGKTTPANPQPSAW